MLAGIETLHYLKYQSHLECSRLSAAMNVSDTELMCHQ